MCLGGCSTRKNFKLDFNLWGKQCIVQKLQVFPSFSSLWDGGKEKKTQFQQPFNTLLATKALVTMSVLFFLDLPRSISNAGISVQAEPSNITLAAVEAQWPRKRKKNSTIKNFDMETGIVICSLFSHIKRLKSTFQHRLEKAIDDVAQLFLHRV